MRIAILSDIHSNLAALEVVLSSLGTVDGIWQLGDVVGYGPEPDGVVERLRAVGAIGVQGNHDAGVSGTFPIDWFNSEGRAAIEWTRARMTADTAAFLAALPLTLEPPDTGFTLVHGSPREPLVEYLFAAVPAQECLDAISTPRCLVGHTHQPVAFREIPGGAMTTQAGESGSVVRLGDARIMLNPGSVGQPRDGNPLASYAILDTTAGTVTWHRVGYDIGATQAAIVAAGLPRFLAQRLALGM